MIIDIEIEGIIDGVIKERDELKAENKELKRRIESAIANGEGAYFYEFHLKRQRDEIKDLSNKLKAREEEVRILKEQIERMQKAKNPDNLGFIFCGKCTAFLSYEKDVHEHVAELEEQLKQTRAIKEQLVGENTNLKKEIERLALAMVAPRPCGASTHDLVIDDYVCQGISERVAAFAKCTRCDYKVALTDLNFDGRESL